MYNEKKITLLHHLSLQKAFKNVVNADIDLAASTINCNINIPYRFGKSTPMEHYYDEPTHAPIYQKKKYRTEISGKQSSIKTIITTNEIIQSVR